MKADQLLDAVGEVRDEFVLDAGSTGRPENNNDVIRANAAPEEAEFADSGTISRKERMKWMKILSLAAVLMLFLGGGFLVHHFWNRPAVPPAPVPAPENSNGRGDRAEVPEPGTPGGEISREPEPESYPEPTILHPGDPGYEDPNVGPTLDPSGSSRILTVLSECGLEAKIYDGAASCGAEVPPYTSREEFLEHLKSSTILDCTVEECCRIKVWDPDGERMHFITTMTLSLNKVLHGKESEDRFYVVNAASTNEKETTGFLAYPVERCHEGMRAAFVLRKAEDSWRIGSKEVPVSELGDYCVVRCLGLEGDTITYPYQDISVNLSELE